MECNLAQKTADSDGWEAWRVATQPFDPQGAGSICSQARSTLRNSKIAMTKWEVKVRIYEKRSAMQLLDGIKCSVFIQMTERRLKEPLVVNAGKLLIYGVCAKKPSVTWRYKRQNSEPNAMEVDPFAKSKHSKGSGSKRTHARKNWQERSLGKRPTTLVRSLSIRQTTVRDKRSVTSFIGKVGWSKRSTTVTRKPTPAQRIAQIVVLRGTWNRNLISR